MVTENSILSWTGGLLNTEYLPETFLAEEH